jgi:hypothetical protein
VPLLFIAIPLAAIVVLNVFYTMIDRRAAMWTGMGVALFQLVYAGIDAPRPLLHH